MACRSARPCGCWPAPASAGMRSCQGQAQATGARPIAGPWLAETLAALRQPRDEPHGRRSGSGCCKATLRPYQQVGRRNGCICSRKLRLGACLADDMGLGKTIQVHFAAARAQASEAMGEARSRRILVAPASLLANWASEIARFAPSLSRR